VAAVSSLLDPGDQRRTFFLPQLICTLSRIFAHKLTTMIRIRPVLATTVALCTLSIVPCGLSHAEPQNYLLDPSHSRIFFDTSHQGFSLMQGMFRTFGGVFEFDADEPTHSTIDITISAGSVDMFDPVLNSRLLTDQFFDVPKHPELHFVSTAIKKLGANRYAVEGNLTLLGVCHPVSFEATQNKLGEQTAGNASGVKVGFSARGTLDRSAFGMTYALPGIGREVAFRLEIEAVEATGDLVQRTRASENVRC
jgi:polyisoprenoid-binding protein YceI